MSSATLADLTVPENRLPDGCRLRTLEADAQPRQATAGHITSTPFEPNGVRTNPWTGRDRSVLVAIRRMIDGPPRVQDGPPLNASETAAFVSQLAEGIEEGYAATYAQPIGRDVLVQALRFATLPTEDLDLFSQRPARLRARGSSLAPSRPW